MADNTREYRRISKLVREACYQQGTPYPIEFVDGFDSPRTVGRRYHHVTQSGTVVNHPNAYLRKARSARLTYVPSTVRIRVGAGWVLQRLMAS